MRVIPGAILIGGSIATGVFLAFLGSAISFWYPVLFTVYDQYLLSMWKQFLHFSLSSQRNRTLFPNRHAGSQLFVFQGRNQRQNWKVSQTVFHEISKNLDEVYSLV